MFKSDVVFSGYYGQKNTGDDAFVEVAAWGAKKLWKTDNVKFLSSQKKLPHTIVRSSGYPLSIPKTYRFQQNLLMNNCQYFISAGGSTFNKYITSDSIKGKSQFLKTKKGDKFKLGAIGVSLGPFSSLQDEKSVVEYLKHFDFLALRDKRSYLYANSLDLPYTPTESFDLAAILPDVYDFKKRTHDKDLNKLKTIGISLCNYESYISNGNLNNEDRRNTRLVELIRALNIKDNYHFKFFIINGHETKGDLKITQSTIHRCGLGDNYSIFDYSRYTKKVWEEIGSCDFIISTRLHAGIFACFAEVPFIMVEYHQKCTDFLSDVGYNDSYRIFDAEFDLREVADNIVNLTNNPHIYESPKHLENMKRLSYKNFEILNF